MFQRFERYLISSILSTFFTVLLIALVAYFLFEFTARVAAAYNELGPSGFSILSLYILKNIPSALTYGIHAIYFISLGWVIIKLHRWKELQLFFLLGRNVWHLIKPLFAATVIIFLFAFANQEGLSPYIQNHYPLEWSLNRDSIVKERPRIVSLFGDKLFLYRSMSNNFKSFKKVVLWEFRGENQLQISLGDALNYLKDRRWEIIDGKIVHALYGSENRIIKQYPVKGKRILQLAFTPSDIKMMESQFFQPSFKDLQQMLTLHKGSKKVQYIWYRRIISPLSLFAFMFLLAFMMAQFYLDTFQRIIQMGGGILLIYYFLVFWVGNFSRNAILDPLLGASIPLLFLLLAIGIVAWATREKGVCSYPAGAA